jgi:hypothetical protein
MNKEYAIGLWMSKGLSLKAARCLVKAGILNHERLIEKMMVLDEQSAIYQFFLSHCGRSTTDEIWTFITNLKTHPPQQKPLTSYADLSKSAKADLTALGIEDDNQLLNSGLTHEEVHALHRGSSGIDKEGGAEIWTLLQNLRNLPRVKDESRIGDVSKLTVDERETALFAWLKSQPQPVVWPVDSG